MLIPVNFCPNDRRNNWEQAFIISIRKHAITLVTHPEKKVWHIAKYKAERCLKFVKR